MPSFENKMSDLEMDMLVTWLTGNYFPTEVEDYPDRASEVAEAVADRFKSEGENEE